MIDWKDSRTHQPEDDELIWVLTCHWKEKKPGSYEIFRGFAIKIAGGEVESYLDKEKVRQWRVNTCDDDGSGCHCYYPQEHAFINENHRSDYYHVFTHWCYDHEMNVPDEASK